MSDHTIDFEMVDMKSRSGSRVNFVDVRGPGGTGRNRRNKRGGGGLAGIGSRPAGRGGRDGRGGASSGGGSRVDGRPEQGGQGGKRKKKPGASKGTLEARVPVERVGIQTSPASEVKPSGRSRRKVDKESSTGAVANSAASASVPAKRAKSLDMWGLPRSGNYPKDADDGTDGTKPTRKGGGEYGIGGNRTKRVPKPFTKTEASVPKPSRRKKPKE
jgi:ribonuclease R